MLIQFLVNRAAYRHARELHRGASPAHRARVLRIQLTVTAILVAIIAGVVIAGLAARPR